MYLDHLERLHDTLETPDDDPLHVWWIYAAPDADHEERPPTDAEFVPYHASNEGIACVDDVARIAVAYRSHYELRGDDHSRERLEQALAFVRYMQRPDGTFLNFVTDPAANETVFGDPDPDVVDGIRVDGTATSRPSLEFWSSRACWALGEGYDALAGDDPALADDVEESLRSFVGALESGPLSEYGEYDETRGERTPAWLPSGGTYAAAPAVLGLAAYCRGADDDRAEAALRKLADGIRDCRAGDPVVAPFGAHLSSPPGSYWHTWGLRQAAALARAGDVLAEADYVASARREVAALHTLHLGSDAQIASFGPAPLPYHQLSYGTDALVQGCTELWRATGEPTFARLGAQLATWYDGNNVERVRMWDPDAGRGYDGIYQDAVDWDAGAESTVAAVRTMLDLERYPESARTAGPVEDVDDRSWTVVDAESGDTDAWASRLNPESASAVFSSGQVVEVFEDGRVTLDPDLPPGEYRPYVVVDRTIAPESTVVVTAGDQRRTSAIGNSPEAYYQMVALDPVEVAADDRVTVEYRGARDRSARVDALVFHPAVAWRTVLAEGGAGAVAVARSVVDDRRTASIPLPVAGRGSLSVRAVDEAGRVVREREETVDPREETGDRREEPDDRREDGAFGREAGDEPGSDARGDDEHEGDDGRREVAVAVEPRGFSLVRATTEERPNGG